MPTYQYRCEKCRVLFHADTRTVSECPIGHPQVKRNYSFTFGLGVKEHWNGSVGKYVSNERHLRDELSRASDEHSEKTGTEHRYVMADVGEMRQQFGVSEDA
jgi:hypothetical protein